jgi:hypothetical protein
MVQACVDTVLVLTGPAIVAPKHAGLAAQCVHRWRTSPVAVQDGRQCVRHSIVHTWPAADRRTVTIRRRDITKAITAATVDITAARSLAVTAADHRSLSIRANIAVVRNPITDIIAALVPTSDTMRRVARRMVMDIRTIATAVTNGCIITRRTVIMRRTVITHRTSVTHRVSTTANVIATRRMSRGITATNRRGRDITVPRTSIAITKGTAIVAMSVICDQSGRQRLDSRSSCFPEKCHVETSVLCSCVGSRLVLRCERR